MAETYTVKAGDTLNKIAGSYGFKNYKEAGITGYRSGNADLIYAGEKLTIGGYKPPATATSGTANDIINANQDADIAAGADEAPTRDSGKTSRTSRYSTAFSEVSDIINPAGNRPKTFSSEDTFNTMREELGLENLENYLNDLQTEEEEIFATLRQRRTAERGKTVAQNVIEGRISQTERQESERLDYIRRQKQTAVNQLQAANATIENIINFKKLDYDTARNEYNDAFSQQMTMFNTVKGIVDSEISDEERASTAARANLNIIYDSIREGEVDTATLAPEMKYEISKMELSAGLPTGFYENLKNQNPDGKILSTTTRDTGSGKYADVLMRAADGSISVKSVYLGASSGGSGGKDSKLIEAELERAAKSEMTSLLQQKVGEDGKVSPTDYDKARRFWASKGFDAKSFDQTYYNLYARGSKSDVSEYNIDDTVLNPPAFY